MSNSSEARALGLVHSSTSDTVELDTCDLRKKRMRKATITGARLIQHQLSRGGQRTYPVMITLTYAGMDLWHSQHVSVFLKICREWFRRQGKRFHYCWVAELQQRGAVHYHVLVWMPKGITLPKPDKHGWWPHGMTRIEKARNAVGYMAKYVSKKATSRPFPKGLRMHGRGGLNNTGRIEMRWWCSPLWVRQWCSNITDVRRVTGGGFVCVDTGEWRPSPYEVFLEGGSIFLRIKRSATIGELGTG